MPVNTPQTSQIQVGEVILYWERKISCSAELTLSVESPLNVFPGCDEMPSRAHHICWQLHTHADS